MGDPLQREQGIASPTTLHEEYNLVDTVLINEYYGKRNKLLPDMSAAKENSIIFGLSQAQHSVQELAS